MKKLLPYIVFILLVLYILFGFGWYGPGYANASDASKAGIPDFAFPGIIQYGKERGVDHTLCYYNKRLKNTHYPLI